MISTVIFHILKKWEWSHTCVLTLPTPWLCLLHYDIGFFRCKHDIIVSFYTWDMKRQDFESKIPRVRFKKYPRSPTLLDSSSALPSICRVDLWYLLIRHLCFRWRRHFPLSSWSDIVVSCVRVYWMGRSVGKKFTVGIPDSTTRLENRCGSHGTFCA